MGIVLRQSTISNGTNTITVKGSALSYIEGDSNFMHLLTNMSGSNISITGSNVGILSTNTTINGTFKLPSITNSNNNNLVTYNSSTGQLYYFNTASINVGTASYVNPLVQNLTLTGSIFVVTSSAVTLGQFVGNQNGYVEFSIRNTSTGISASGDIAVYADNGTVTNNYIDMGINNSGLSNSYFYGGTDYGDANDAYLYNVGGNLRIGNATSVAPFSQSLFIFSNPSARPDITITGSRVGIQKTGPLNAALDVSGSTIISGSLNVSGSGRFINDLTVTGSITSNTGVLVKHYPGGFTHATEDYEPGSTGTILYTSVGAQTGNTFVELTVRQNGGSLSSGVLALNASGGGAVAIGKSTATSTSALDINGNTIITGSLNVTSGITGSLLGTSSFATTSSHALTVKGGANNYIPLWTGSTQLSSSVIYQSGAGSVGINIASPIYSLDVNGNGRFSSPLWLDAAVGNSNLSFVRPDGASTVALSMPSSTILKLGGSNLNFIDVYTANAFTARFSDYTANSTHTLTTAGGLFVSGTSTVYSNIDYLFKVIGAGGSGIMNINNIVQVSGSHTILPQVSSSLNFADDTAAAAGGVPLGGLYRNGNVISIRIN
jgi:hypothetical protein